MITNWLGAGPLLAVVIAAGLPTLGPVRMVSSIQEAQALVTASPSCFVAWMGDSVSDNAGRGKVSMVDQKWAVIIVRKAGEDAGALLSSVITALSGMELSDEYDGLRFAGSGGALFDGTYVFYPLHFSTAVIAA